MKDLHIIAAPSAALPKAPVDSSHRLDRRACDSADGRKVAEPRPTWAHR